MFQFLVILSTIVLSLALDNGLARTPPMGWCSWNHYHRHYNETLFYQTADAFVSKGLKKCGYEYINIDGGWWEGVDTRHIVRNSTGYILASKEKFPKGIETMIAYIHSKGLKYGHYTDAGKHACNKDAPMSEGYEHQDATLFASWGIDMIKIDSCGTTEPAKTLMKRWHDELNATGRPILLSNCHNYCNGTTWDPWCAEWTNMWRTSNDIQGTWKKIMWNLDSLKGRGKYGKPGSWNDPDFLEVDTGNLRFKAGNQKIMDENQAHFSLWVITSSPLILGNDVINMHENITNLVTNKQAISINQAYAGNAGDLLSSKDNAEIWYKPLPSLSNTGPTGSAAVVLFNRDDDLIQNISVALKDLPSLGGKTSCSCCSVWEGLCKLCKNVYVEELRPHQASLVQIENC